MSVGSSTSYASYRRWSSLHAVANDPSVLLRSNLRWLRSRLMGPGY